MTGGDFLYYDLFSLYLIFVSFLLAKCQSNNMCTPVILKKLFSKRFDYSYKLHFRFESKLNDSFLKVRSSVTSITIIKFYKLGRQDS